MTYDEFKEYLKPGMILREVYKDGSKINRYMVLEINPEEGWLKYRDMDYPKVKEASLDTIMSWYKDLYERDFALWKCDIIEPDVKKIKLIE